MLLDHHLTFIGGALTSSAQLGWCGGCRLTKWSTCALSGEPLATPVVCDFLGQLYNKAAVLEFLLAKQGVFSEEAQVRSIAGPAGAQRQQQKLRLSYSLWPREAASQLF